MRNSLRFVTLAYLCALASASFAGAEDPTTPTIAIETLAGRLEVGDVVFIRVDQKPFREIAATTGTWTNHVGIVVSAQGGEVLIGESAFPWSRLTPLARLVARSKAGRIAVLRFVEPLSAEEKGRILAAATEQQGILYDTGFDLHSHREFCSRYVREVVLAASGRQLGEVETFRSLFAKHPDANLGFWRLWYFGRIPWDRETVTPASLYSSPRLAVVFDGVALPTSVLPIQ